MSPMQDDRKHRFEEMSSAKGCVAFYLHRILSTNLKRGSLLQFLPHIKATKVSINSLPEKCISDLDHICRYAPHVKLVNGALDWYVPSQGTMS